MADVQYYCVVATPELNVTERVRAACREGATTVPVVVHMDRERALPPAGQEPKVVRIQCTQDHWCDFPCQPPAGAARIDGVRVGAAELAIWEGWRSHADPLKGLERLEGYAKWVLGANALVVLLASSLAASGGVQLETTWAKLLYAVAIAFLGLSWAAVSLSIAPKWVRINRQSPSDFVEGFNAQYGSRRRWLSAATIALGLALATAALVPLGDRIRTRPFASAGIGYEVKPNGEVVAQLSGAGLPPHTSVELVLQAARSQPGQALARRRGLVDSVGKSELSLTLDSVRAQSAARPLLVTGRWMTRQGDGLVQKQESAQIP